jgi:hypothetical protein
MVPLAVNRCVTPVVTLAVEGVIERVDNIAGVTVKVTGVEEITFVPSVIEALMLVAPTATVEATPVALNLATA